MLTADRPASMNPIATMQTAITHAGFLSSRATTRVTPLTFRANVIVMR